MYGFVLPALLPMLLVVGFPLLQTVFFSFTNLREKNFDLWTLGIAPSTARASGSGVFVETAPGGPAGRAGLTSGTVVTEVNGERVASPPALRRLLEKAERRFKNQGVKDVVFTVRAGPAETTAAVTVGFARVPFDWRPDGSRDATSWGIVGLRNYREILVPDGASSPGTQFYRVLGITVLWTLANVSLHYLLGLGLALLLNTGVRGVHVYRVLLMIPWAVPVYVSAFAWRWLFNNQYGFFNVLLQRMGASPVPWLSDSTWTFVAVTATNVWLGVPFMMVTLLAGMQAIPRDLYESAEIDGCSRLGMLRHVTLPLLRPVTQTAVLLGAIWTFNMFNVIWLVQGGGNTVEILATQAFRLFNDNHDYARASAFGTVILALLLGFSLLYLRLTRRTEGAA